MIYLSGALRAEFLAAGLGWMATPMQGSDPDRLAGAPWAADTGCFANPAGFSLPAYLAWLGARAAHRRTCLFATAPDVVGDAVATLELALPVLPLLRGVGYKPALVAQDGLEAQDVPWDAFECLFVGGTTTWKLSEAAYGLARRAKERGKWLHMGRVNSLRRLRAAEVAGFDSADGTFLKFAPGKNLPRVREWLRDLRERPALPLWT